MARLDTGIGSWSRRGKNTANTATVRHAGSITTSRAPTDTAQNPLVVGRSIAALASTPDLMERSGSIQWVEDLGQEFGIVDEFGRSPAAYTKRL
jgi:hypothetical protein